MTANNDIQEIIYRHRKAANLSRAQLASMAGVGKTVIYDLENGKETVQWSTIRAILDALNIHIRFESPLLEADAQRTDTSE